MPQKNSLEKRKQRQEGHTASEGIGGIDLDPLDLAIREQPLQQLRDVGLLGGFQLLGGPGVPEPIDEGGQQVEGLVRHLLQRVLLQVLLPEHCMGGHPYW